MRRTRRSLAGIASVFAVSLVVAGCSGSDDDPEAPDTPGGDEPQEEVELTIAWWGNDERAALMAEAIDLFEEEYPYITVVEQPVGNPDDLFNRLATDFASGTAPDVFALGGAKPQEYGAAGTLLDMGSVADVVELDMYEDFTLTNATVDDTVYGLPTGGNAIGLLINETVFEEAGVDLPDGDFTWEEFVETANAISANHPDGAIGLDLRVQDILGTYVAQYTEYGIYDWDGELATGADTIQQWYELEVELLEGGGLPDPSVVVQNQNVTPDLTPFGTGQAGMAFSYSNQIGAYAAGTGGDTISMRLPPVSTDVSGVAVLPSQFWAIAAETDHPEESAMLVDWLLNEEAPAEIIQANRGLPFNPETLAVVEPLLSPEDAQAAAYLQEVLEQGVVAPPQPAGGAILNELTQRMESEVLFGRLSPADAAEQWIAELGAALESA